eukprot:5701922-Prymnesium_polylepis.1
MASPLFYIPARRPAGRSLKAARRSQPVLGRAAIKPLSMSRALVPLIMSRVWCVRRWLSVCGALVRVDPECDVGSHATGN